MANPFFRRIVRRPAIKPEHGQLYDTLKPLWLELRFLGVLPVVKVTTEVGKPVFRRTFGAMLYSVVFYMVVGVFVVHTGVVKLQELRELKSSEFDEAVHGYMFLVYLVPHIALPLCHWRQAEAIANFMTAWTTFQVRFEQVTRVSLQMNASRKVTITMAVLVPLFTTVCIVVDWSVMPEFKVSEIYCYIYICTLVYLHIALWFTMCCSVATTTRHLMNVLRKGVQSGRHVSDYHSLWQELSQLSRKMGDCFCYIYGTVIVIWFAALTLCLYGGLIAIFNHGIHLRGITLLCNTVLCTSVLFVISDAGHRVCQEMGTNFYGALHSLRLGANKEIKQELDFFRYDVAMNPPVISLGGYVAVNRNLLLSLLATAVSHIVILVQFRIGVEPLTQSNTATHSSLFNQSCKLMCE